MLMLLAVDTPTCGAQLAQQLSSHISIVSPCCVQRANTAGKKPIRAGFCAEVTPWLWQCEARRRRGRGGAGGGGGEVLDLHVNAALGLFSSRWRDRTGAVNEPLVGSTPHHHRPHPLWELRWKDEELMSSQTGICTKITTTHDTFCDII